MKRIRPWIVCAVLVFILMPIGVPVALAAPVNGTVVAIDYYTVRVVIVGKLPAWVKKGHSVRFLEVRSLVVGISADTLDIGSSNTGNTKVGAFVTLKKWKPGANGC